MGWDQTRPDHFAAGVRSSYMTMKIKMDDAVVVLLLKDSIYIYIYI